MDIIQSINKVSRINKISGPTSMYYLKPTQYILDLKDTYFPLIVLFGDDHNSYDDTCLNCTCNNTDKECCFNIYDHKFLQMIDELADDTHPIDFYVETFTTGMEGFAGGPIEHFTKGEILTCFHHKLRNTEFDKCPTKKIRWHGSDIRYAGDNLTINSTTKKHESTFMDKDTNDFFNKIYPNIHEDTLANRLSHKIKIMYYIEPRIKLIIDKLYLYLEYLYDNDKVTSDFVLKERIIYYCNNSLFRNVSNFIELLKSLFNKDTKELDTHQFSTKLFEMMHPYNSLIIKQLEKQSFNKLKDINIWIKIYSDLLSEYIKLDEKNIRFIISNLHLFCNDRIEFELRRNILLSNFDDKEKFDDINNFIRVYVTLPMLDIYTILRMFKQPTDGIKASISFVYIGNIHVKNIVNILMKELSLYNIYYKNINNKAVFRCLHLYYSINIHDDLNKHNRLIDSKKLYSVLNNYLSKIIDINNSDYSKIHDYTIDQLMDKIQEITKRLHN